MHPFLEHQLQTTRRELLTQAGAGVGLAALATLLTEESRAADTKPAAANPVGRLPGLPHYAAKAKRILYMSQSGAPSHVDLFDWKPNLAKLKNTDLPPSVQMGQRLTTMTAGKRQAIMPAEFKFNQYGKSGLWLSELLKHTGEVADDLCVIRSMNTEAINHAQAMTLMQTGSQFLGRPSLGGWLSYGLGTLNQDLPTYVVMVSQMTDHTCGQIVSENYYGSGFLPSKNQGVRFRGGHDPVLYLSSPPGIDAKVRRGQLDDLARLNELKLREMGDPEISTRIAQYELAYRMQSAIPDVADVSGEPQHIYDMYGNYSRTPGTYAANCLLARRLLERGVRFVQLFHIGWDQHGNLPKQLPHQCDHTDQPSAALVKDLKQRGLLDDTLIVWGGEFGRTVFCQGDLTDPARGRDHHGRCFSLWTAGAGIKPGVVGETDEFAYNIVKDPVHVHDLQATILHLFGIDHTKFTFKFQGRHYRLTDVDGHVVKPMLA